MRAGSETISYKVTTKASANDRRLFIMNHDLLCSPMISVVIILVAFFLMIWPGYALLHLLGHGRAQWSSALFAGPAVTLALWIVTMSGAAWASVPLSKVSLPIWIATVGLAGLGAVLSASVNSQSKVGQEESLRSRSLLWLAAVLVPLTIMPATLRYGVGTFANSTYPDAWSYVAVADYLSAVARGTEGNLSALHQYASHLMNTRNASSAILAHLAVGLGGIKADEAMSLFCLVVLFAYASALVAFAQVIFRRTGEVISFLLLAGLGWPADIVFAGNFDQLLMLSLLPAIAALALRTGRGNHPSRAGLIISILTAAAIYAYVELAFLGIVVALSFTIFPETKLRAVVLRIILLFCIATPLTVLLTEPGLTALVSMFRGQYSMATGVARPGEGFFPGLLSHLRLPDALWSLGGEFLQKRWVGAPLAVGAILGAVTVVGVWFERRRWSVTLAFAITVAAFVYFAYFENYSYGAYKILSTNFWMISFFTVVGGISLASWMEERLPRRIRFASVAATMLLVITLIRSAVQVSVGHFDRNALQQIQFREAVKIAGMVGDAPTLLSVRDPSANEWGVFYLSEMPLLVAPYRLYMAQSHVIPFMNRAKVADPGTIRYIVTDRSDSLRAALTGAKRTWDGQVFSLWEVDNIDWAVVADLENPNGIEPDGTWLGGPKAEFLIVSGHAGTANLTGNFQPGLRAPPGTTAFHLILEDASGRHQIIVRPGENILPIDLAIGKTSIGITVDEPVSGPVPANGDMRPIILRLTDYKIKSHSIQP